MRMGGDLGLLAGAIALAMLPACSSGNPGAATRSQQTCATVQACARAAEARHLMDSQSGVRRAGDTLVVETSGSEVRFTDSADGDRDGAWYGYAGRIAPIGYHLIEVRYYEGGGYLLVDADTGRQTPCVGVPVVSPGGLRIVATSVDLEARQRPTSIQIWRVGETGLVPEYERNFIESDWGPGRARWSGDEELRFPRLGRGGSDRGSATLKLTMNGWQSEDFSD